MTKDKFKDVCVLLFTGFNLYTFIAKGEYWFGVVALVCTTFAFLGLWFIEDIALYTTTRGGSK